MAVKTRDELMTSLRAHLGEDTSDAALALIEDVQDTVDSLFGNTDGIDWEQRYHDNDAEWRRRYRDRFFGGSDNDDFDDNDDNDKNKGKKKPRTYAELFNM